MSDPAAGDRPVRPELRSLTGLRFLAAFHVVLFHAIFAFSRASVHLPRGTVRNILSTGYVSVSLFFVLSGFVLAYAYVDGTRMTTSAPRFWRARLARIYPMHLIGVALAVPLFVLGSQANHVADGVIAKEAARQVALSVLLVQAWVPAHALDLNGPSWSLSVEAFFYLSFPLLVRLLAPLRARALALVAILAWTAALVPPLLHRGPPTFLAPKSDIDLALLFNPLVRLPDFVLGVATGLFFLQTQRERGAWKQAPIVAAATSILVFALLAESDHLPFALLHNGLLDPLWALLIFALAMRGGEARGIGNDAFVRGGHASYSLYVLHKPLYSWAALVFGMGMLPPSMFLGAFVGGSVLVAVLAWQHVEEPLRRVVLGQKRRG